MATMFRPWWRMRRGSRKAPKICATSPRARGQEIRRSAASAPDGFPAHALPRSGSRAKAAAWRRPARASAWRLVGRRRFRDRGRQRLRSWSRKGERKVLLHRVGDKFILERVKPMAAPIDIEQAIRNGWSPEFLATLGSLKDEEIPLPRQRPITATKDPFE